MSRVTLVSILLIVGMTACSDDHSHGARPGLMSQRSMERSVPGRPSIASLYPNGIRFTASPALEGLHYLVELRGPILGAEDDRYCQATGVFVVYAWGRRAGEVNSLSYPLNVGCSDYRLVVAQVDHLLATARLGPSEKDGTPMTVERVSLTGLNYYDDGNVGYAGDPSLAISALMQGLVRQYGPREAVPDRADWYPNPGAALPAGVQKLVDASAGR